MSNQGLLISLLNVTYTLCSFLYFRFIHINLLISYAPSSIHAYDQFLYFYSIKSLFSFSLMYYSLYCLCTIKISPFLSHYIYICFNLQGCWMCWFWFPPSLASSLMTLLGLKYESNTWPQQVKYKLFWYFLDGWWSSQTLLPTICCEMQKCMLQSHNNQLMWLTLK